MKLNKIYLELQDNPDKYSETTIHFLNHQIKYLLIYTSSATLIGLLSGYLFQYIVNLFRLDVKFEILQFRNKWSYIFSGRYLNFSSFKKTHNEINLGEIHPLSKSNAMITLIDALISENNTTKLYSGTLVDYDINRNDSSLLERIYLENVYRYKHSSEEERKENSNLPPFEKKEIRGDVFIVETKNLINLNITYVPAEYRVSQNNERKQRIKAQWKNLFSVISLLAISFIGVIFFTGFNNLIINFIYENYNVFQKIWLIFTLLSIWSIIFYSKEKKEENNKNFKDAVGGMIWLIIVSIGFALYEIYW